VSRILIFIFVIVLASLLLGATAGQYVGTWTSDGGVNTGKVNITLNNSGDGDLTFSYQAELIKPKKVTAKVNGNQVEFICDVDLEGLRLKSTFTGTVDGKSMSGKYQSSSADDGSVLDSGTWKVTQQ
jgi:hypothetical protein